MKIIPPLSLALALAGGPAVSSARGQTPAPIEQARLRSSMFDYQQEIPAEFAVEPEEEAVETPGDLDLGVQLIMKARERAHLLRLFATLDEFYTNNAGLAKHDTLSDTYLFAEIGARYEGKLSELFGVEATVRQAVFRYHDVHELDFESFNAGAGAGYRMPELADITLFARYNCERLTNNGFGDEFLLNQTLSFGAQKSWIRSEKQIFHAGYAGTFGFADPVAAERHEYSLFGGTHLRLAERLDADLYWRLALFDFRSGQRDFNQMIAPSLTYRFNDWCELNASFSFVLNRSNRSRFDYDAITTGGGLNFKLQF